MADGTVQKHSAEWIAGMNYWWDRESPQRGLTQQKVLDFVQIEGVNGPRLCIVYS